MNLKGTFQRQPSTTQIRPVNSLPITAYITPEYIYLPEDSHSYIDQDFATDNGLLFNELMGTRQILGTLVTASGVIAEIRQAEKVCWVYFTAFSGLRKLIGAPIAYGQNYIKALNAKVDRPIHLGSLLTEVNKNKTIVVHEREKTVGSNLLRWCLKLVPYTSIWGGQNNLTVFRRLSNVI